MLYWVYLFILSYLISFFSLILVSFSLWSLLLQSEFIIMVFFLVLCSCSLIFNLSYLLGLAFILLILSGLEVAVGFLLLAI